MRRFIDHWQVWGLICLLMVGLVLRLLHMGMFPPGLTTDEAAITYDAWGLSIDGKDQWGHQWPLLFISLGDGKLPLTHYLLAAGFRIFGFQLYGIRILAALSGTALIWGTYFLTTRLLRKPTTALLAAALVTFSPWTIHFSRFGLEAGIAVMLVTVGLALLWRQRVGGVIILALAAYTYHSSLIVAPLLCMSALWMQKELPSIKKVSWSILFGLLLAPLVVVETQAGWTRAAQTVTLPHSVVYIGQRLIDQFSPGFWIEGTQPNYRQAIPGFFVLLLPELFSILVGLWAARNASVRMKVFGGMWFVAALLPSLIGQPSPHTIRAFHVVPLIFIVEAVGWSWLLNHWRRTALVLASGYAIWWGLFWSYYRSSYTTQAATDYGYGYEAVLNYLAEQGDLNTTYVISPFMDQPYLYTLLYWRITPPEFRAGGLANVAYRPIQWPEAAANTWYAGSVTEISPNDPRVVKIISYPHSSQPLWVIAH